MYQIRYVDSDAEGRFWAALYTVDSEISPVWVIYSVFPLL